MSTRPRTLLGLSCLLVAGCHDTLDRVADKAEATCHENAPCVVNVTDVTGFDWDKMYIFRGGAQRAYIEKTIGLPFPDWEELSEQVLFVRGNEIVKSESYDDFEANGERVVGVNFSDHAYYEIPRSSPGLIVRIYHDPKQRFYAIEPVTR